MVLILPQGQALKRNKGLDNILISKILKKIAPNRFYGIFSCDELPIARLKHVHLFCIVVNLATSFQRNGHWITIIRKYNDVYFIDPLGNSCLNIHILKMLVALNLNLEENLVMIQSPHSSACGYFAIKICYLFEKNICVRNTNIHEYFETDVYKLEENDEVCINLIKKKLKKIRVKVKMISE